MSVEQLGLAKEAIVNTRRVLEANPGFADRAEFACITCDVRYPTRPDPVYECARDGDILDVIYRFPVDLDPEELKDVWVLRRTSQRPEDRSGVFRFREFIPFVDDSSQVVTLGEGNTPLLEAPGCAQYVGLKRLQVKHQGWNPTGSFKDPGMAAAATQARILGTRAILCGSTGNTSASEAAYARRAGMLGIVLLPKGQISYGKLSQVLDYGALTLQVDTDFDGCMNLTRQIAPRVGAYIVNSLNAFRIEGQKTIVAELLEQRGWRVPDRIIVAGGNLGHAAALWKGLRELKMLGFIDKLPKLTVVQAQGANPLYQTITSGDDSHLITVHARTLATAVKIGDPVSWKKALDGIKQTNGWVTQVNEQQIADAKAVVGRDGIGCEPASALAIAGLKRIVEEGTDVMFDKDEEVVAILTGHMLKDPDYIVFYHADNLHEEFDLSSQVTPRGVKIVSTFANRPIPVEPDADQIVRVISERLKLLR